MAPARAPKGARPASLVVAMAACFLLAASGAAAAATEAAAAAAVLADLRSISARRVEYISARLAARRSGSRALAEAAELGSLGGWASSEEPSAFSLARPRNLLSDDSSQAARDESTDLEAVRADPDKYLEAARLDPDKYWQLPPPPPPMEDGGGNMLVPAASVDPGRVSAAAATQVVETVTEHFADMAPTTSFKPGSLRQMDLTLRVNENRIAKPRCVYPGAVITAIILPVYGQFTLPRRCNSTLSYQIVAAACMGESRCAVLASNEVFGDACPGAQKTLSFTYRCVVQDDATPMPDIDTSPAPQSPSFPPPGRSPSAPFPPPPSPPPSSPPPVRRPRPPSPPPPSPPPPEQPGSPPPPPSIDLGSLTPVPERSTTIISPGLRWDLAFPPTALPEAPEPLSPGCFQPTGDVKKFGARGDGATDDTAALREANSKAPTVLYFPRGVYRLRRNITLTKPVVMGAFTRFQLDRGVMLTLTQQPRRPPNRGDAMFTGEGFVQFTGSDIELYPDWWKSDDRGETASLQLAIDSCAASWCQLLQTKTIFTRANDEGIDLNPRIRYFATARANIHSLSGRGIGVTLQPGDYSQPISFAGIFGFADYGLRFLPGVANANIQAGFISKNRQAMLLSARASRPLRNVTISHVSVTQDNLEVAVFNSLDPTDSLFEGVTVRVNFELMGGQTNPRVPSAGVIFRGGVPTLRNTQYILQANDPAQFQVRTLYNAITTATPGPVRNFAYRSECWNGGFEPGGLYLGGSFRSSFFHISVNPGEWSTEFITLNADSAENVINTGGVASASRAWDLVDTSNDLRSFGDGKPVFQQGFYMRYKVTRDWPTNERRTLYFFSPFAQGVNSKTQMHCIPFLAWNPGLFCDTIERAPLAQTGYPAYQMAVSLVNLSRKTIPATFTHVFGVQFGP